MQQIKNNISGFFSRLDNSKAQFWIAFSIIGTIVVFGVWFTQLTQNYADQNSRTSFINLANVAAASIDSGNVKKLSATQDDIKSTEHQIIKNKLIQIRKSSSDMRFVYLMKSIADKIVFLVDAEPVDSDDYSPPGQIYTSASEKLRKIFEDKKPFVEGPIRDDWGTWMSAHAPIIDKESNEVVAIIGLDIDAKTWKETVGYYLWGSIGITTLLCALALTYIISLRRIYNINAKLETTSRKLQDAVSDLDWTNKELEAFTSSVSHDLRSPLRHITGYANELREESESLLDDESLNYLSRIQAAAKKMEGMINAFLELSRSGKHDIKKQKTNVSDLARQVADRLTQSLAKPLPIITVQENMTALCDPKLLNIVLENLIGNAIKYSSKLDLAQIKVGMKHSDGKDIFFVNDNGAGFNINHADRLFKPLQRLHAADEFDGIGIGLSIVYRIIKRHGGNVWAESEINKGATFYFTLN